MGCFTASSAIVLLVALIIIHTTQSETDYSYLEDEYKPIKKDKDPDSELELDSTADSDDEQLTNVTMTWDQLSWKILCDEDEWRSQFAGIREKLTECLELSQIILPGEPDVSEDEKQKRTWSLMFSDGKSNPYCRVSRNWIKCHHMLKDITCLDPNAVPLEAQKSGVQLKSQVEQFVPVYKNKEEWIAMHRPYKLHCLLSKVASTINPFSMFGGGGFF